MILPINNMYIICHTLDLTLIQILQALQEVYIKPKGTLPKVLTTYTSIQQLDKEVNSRKVKHTQ